MPVDVSVITSLLTPPARPLMSLKSCSSNTCIAGNAKKPTAARSEQGTVVIYQRGAAYKQSTQLGKPGERYSMIEYGKGQGVIRGGLEEEASKG